MNCANHPEVPVSAYCQNCGKAMCAACMRSVGGVIYCEPCLAERLGMSGASATGAPTGFPGVVAPAGPNPGTAFLLGFIPGVGAMYNGQFIKGLVHVVIFIILIGMTEHVGIFGILVAAWVAYQVFDAFETAKARRDGRALPDPFGLNDLGNRMGIHMGGPAFGPGVTGPGATNYGAAQGFTGGQVPPPPPVAGFTDPYATPPVPPPPGHYYGWGRRREPIGALVLIVLGVLFLLNTLDVFHFDWFGRLWPVLLICFGVALFLKRTRELPPPPPPQSGGGQ